MQSHLRNVTRDEQEELKRIIKDYGIEEACLQSGLCERTIWTIKSKGKKKRISPKTQEGLAHLFKECAPEVDDPAIQAGEATPGPNYEPDPVMDAPEEPSEPTQQPVPPLLEAVTRAIHEGILEAERGRQPMIHQLQAAVLRLESKVDLLAKCQLEDMIAWGLRESANGNGE